MNAPFKNASLGYNKKADSQYQAAHMEMVVSHVLNGAFKQRRFLGIHGQMDWCNLKDRFENAPYYPAYEGATCQANSIFGRFL